jgi:hypothetical protein
MAMNNTGKFLEHKCHEFSTSYNLYSDTIGIFIFINILGNEGTDLFSKLSSTVLLIAKSNHWTNSIWKPERRKNTNSYMDLKNNLTKVKKII